MIRNIVAGNAYCSYRFQYFTFKNRNNFGKIRLNEQGHKFGHEQRTKRTFRKVW